jgi:peptidoglycan/xylan/chitin deacetylase (PgdA/CDA1 family)
VQQAGAVRSMALTFDDLPFVEARAGGQLRDAQRATGALLRALAAHHAPAVGFVNEVKLGPEEQRDARTALLLRWVKGGAILGNHTYSHADLNARSIEQFESEIVQGDVVTRRLMQPYLPYPLFFRHPFTHTGDTQAKKSAIEAFLAERGYRIAPHTIDSEDFVFNVGFAHATERHDSAAAARLGTAYVDFVIQATEFAERIAPQIFGRDIPQTILLHANDLNAAYLDALLTRLEQRGYRFIPLENAMADPAYKTADTLVTPNGPTWLWRWMKSLGLDVSFRGDPEPPDWVMDLYNRGSH